MTNILLTRHAESIWHAENRYAGISDIPITDHGRDQAARLAAWATTGSIDAVWSSDLVRARSTAGPVCIALDLELHTDERLREVDFGTAEGRTSTEIESADPEAWHAFLQDPVAHHHRDGENPRDAVERFTACLEEISRLHSNGRVLLVAHSTVIRLVLCTYLGIPIERYRALFPALGSCAISELRLSGPHPALLGYNLPVAADPAAFPKGS